MRKKIFIVIEKAVGEPRPEKSADEDIYGQRGKFLLLYALPAEHSAKDHICRRESKHPTEAVPAQRERAYGKDVQVGIPNYG